MCCQNCILFKNQTRMLLMNKFEICQKNSVLLKYYFSCLRMHQRPLKHITLWQKLCTRGREQAPLPDPGLPRSVVKLPRRSHFYLIYTSPNKMLHAYARSVITLSATLKDKTNFPSIYLAYYRRHLYFYVH